MIAFVRGQVAQVGVTSVVVDLGSVGLEVQCAPGTIAGLLLLALMRLQGPPPDVS